MSIGAGDTRARESVAAGRGGEVVGRDLERFERRLGQLVGQITEAAVAFERRWTFGALRRADADLARRLDEQRQLWLAASANGDSEEIEVQGGALVRGYRAAVAAMEGAAEPDDAYLVGEDPATGARVAIGPAVVAERVREVLGPRVVCVTPDEVAIALGRLDGFRVVSAVKAAWPGAEVVDVRAADAA